MRITKIHKTLLLGILVVTPFWWFMFTEDGQRRVDTLVLWVAGGQPIDINFKVLNSGYSLNDLRQVYQNIDWQCQPQATAWGSDTCITRLSSYNGIPARYLTAYFLKDRVNGLKLAYQAQYHNALAADIQQQLGKPLAESAGVLKWQTEHGIVLLKKEIQTSQDEAAVLWLPREN